MEGQMAARPPHHVCVVCDKDLPGLFCADNARGHFACFGCWDRHVFSHVMRPVPLLSLFSTVELAVRDAALAAGAGGADRGGAAAAAAAAAGTRLLEQGSVLPCVAAHACSSRLSERALEPALSKATYVALSRALQWLHFGCRYERAAAEAGFSAALRAAAQRAPEERAHAVREVRQAIAERVLLLRCPRCDAVFIDFEACNNLTCARCGAGFCAVCLEDCGASAEAHIKGSAVCGPAEHNVPLFKRAARERFLARVVAAVKALAIPPLQHAVVAELAKADLPNLGKTATDKSGLAPPITEAEVLEGVGVWVCAKCTLINGPNGGGDSDTCTACGAWRCAKNDKLRGCGLVNERGASECAACGKWRCVKCTLWNQKDLKSCSVCGTLCRGGRGGGHYGGGGKGASPPRGGASPPASRGGGGGGCSRGGGGAGGGW